MVSDTEQNSHAAVHECYSRVLGSSPHRGSAPGRNGTQSRAGAGRRLCSQVTPPRPTSMTAR